MRIFLGIVLVLIASVSDLILFAERLPIPGFGLIALVALVALSLATRKEKS